MKAAVYYETGRPEVFRYEDVPDPTSRPGAVLVDVKAVSIEGGDVLQPRGRRHAAKPHIVGYQCAGVIREVGASVGRPQRGPAGGVLSCRTARTRRWSAWRRCRRSSSPTGMDLKQAACVPIAFGTADDCLFEFGRLQGGRDGARAGAARAASAWRRCSSRSARARQCSRRRRAPSARAAEGVRRRPRHQLPRRATGSAQVKRLSRRRCRPRRRLASAGRRCWGASTARRARAESSASAQAGREMRPADGRAIC